MLLQASSRFEPSEQQCVGSECVRCRFDNEWMVLSGGLSNLDTTLIQSLTSDDQRKVRRSRARAHGGWSDGRRRFGTVSGAIVAVLAGAGEMRVRAMRGEVELLLGGSVSRHSVSDYLLTRSKGPRPLFERTRRGHYRLRNGAHAGDSTVLSLTDTTRLDVADSGN